MAAEGRAPNPSTWLMATHRRHSTDFLTQKISFMDKDPTDSVVWDAWFFPQDTTAVLMPQSVM